MKTPARNVTCARPCAYHDEVVVVSIVEVYMTRKNKVISTELGHLRQIRQGSSRCPLGGGDGGTDSGSAKSGEYRSASSMTSSGLRSIPFQVVSRVLCHVCTSSSPTDHGDPPGPTSKNPRCTSTVPGTPLCKYGCKTLRFLVGTSN